MLLSFVNVTLVFLIGTLLVNIIAVALNRRVKWFILSTLIEFILAYVVLYIQLPPKNMTTLINVNILFAFVAAIINLIGYAGLASFDKIRDWGSKNYAKDVSDRTKTYFFRRYIFVAVAPLVLWIAVGAVSFVTKLTSINNVYSSIPAKTKGSSELLTSAKDMPIALAPDTAKRKMQQKFSVIPN